MASIPNYSIKIAPMWRRIVAAVLDVFVVSCALVFALKRWGTTLPNGQQGWEGWSAALVMVLIASYWILPEWLLGATFGKWVLGIRVSSVSNGKATFIQSVKRNLLRPVDFVFFYFTGFVVSMLNPRRQRLGDQWAHTVVVE